MEKALNLRNISGRLSFLLEVHLFWERTSLVNLSNNGMKFILGRGILEKVQRECWNYKECSVCIFALYVILLDVIKKKSIRFKYKSQHVNIDITILKKKNTKVSQHPTKGNTWLLIHLQIILHHSLTSS